MFFIVLSFLIGLGLRLIAINQSLWLDEAISVAAVTKYSLKGFLIQFMPTDFHPPLYYLILHFWLKLFPSTEFFVRLPSVIFGLLTAVFTYKIYLVLFKNEKAAFLSLILLLSSPLHIYYSQEARMYSLAAFLVSASMYYFIKLLKKKSLLFTIYYLLSTIFMLYSHYLCWLVLFSQIIYLFIYHRKRLKIILYSLFLILYIPWLPTLFSQLKAGYQLSMTGSDWAKIIGQLSLKSIGLLPVKFIIGRNSFENKVFYSLIALLLISFFGFLLWQAMKKNTKLIWLWLVVPPILGILISFKIPVFSYFRFLFCLPAFYILAARGIFEFKKPIKAIGLVLIINLFLSTRFLFNSSFHRENWKNAVATLHLKNPSKAPVLVLENAAASFDYYDLKKSKVVYFDAKEKVGNENVVWLIPYVQPIIDPQDSVRIFLKAKGFTRVYEEHFRGVTLEKWQKLGGIAVKFKNR